MGKYKKKYENQKDLEETEAKIQRLYSVVDDLFFSINRKEILLELDSKHGNILK